MSMYVTWILLLTLVFGIITPFPFILSYLKLSRTSVAKSTPKINLCTVADKTSQPNIIAYGFYVTGLLIFGFFYSVNIVLEKSYLLYIFSFLLLVSFLISGFSTKKHSEKVHGIFSRATIILIILSSLTVSKLFYNYQEELSILFATIICASGTIVTIRLFKLKYVDRTTQILFHLLMSVWIYLVTMSVFILKS
jgi:hypothetical protein